MPEEDRGAVDVDDVERDDLERDDVDDPEDDQWRPVHSDDVRAGRRYRPGRGGFDPEAAALAARAKYARRQRIVLIMLLAAVTTALLGAFVWTSAWALHVLVDLFLIGYLAYLRRQVKIEENIRERRLARLSSTRGALETDEVPNRRPRHDDIDEDLDEFDPDGDEAGDAASDEDDSDGVSRGPRIPITANAVTVGIDDEDPVFDELDERTWEPYRRAAGE